MVWRIVLLCGLAGGLALGPGGCRKNEQAAFQPAPAELVMLCGASFLGPVEALCKQFTQETGIAVVVSSGESEDLLPLVKTGRKGDLFVTHDPYLDYVRQAGALADSVQVGVLAPAVVVQKGNPKGIAKFEDLARPGLRVAFTDPKYSTCGELVMALLEKKGIQDAVMKNVDTRLTRGHSRLGTMIKTQVVDAVIMWKAVARNFADSAEVVAMPYEYDREVAVHLMALSHSRQAEALKKFIEFARRKGPPVFQEYGYVK